MPAEDYDQFAYLAQVPTNITLLTCQDNHEDWPNGRVEMTSIVSGALAYRITQRIGVHPLTPVVIQETQTDGGYSTYTRDTNFNFELRVGEERIDLDRWSRNSLDALTTWLERGDD